MRRLLCLFCICCSLKSFSQTYEQCVDYFKNNKYQDAITGLEKLQATNEYKIRASLLLSIMKADEENYVAAFDDFKIFFDHSVDPYPAFYALSNSGIFQVSKNMLGNDVKNFLEDILKDSRADEAVKLIATDLLSKSYALNGDFTGLRKLYENTGDVKNWSTVGAFENVSGSGFNKDFGALEHPEVEYRSAFTNKIGAKVKWFDITTIRNDRWYDFEHQYNIENSIIYAQTFINSEKDMEVLMKIGVSGSLKVWLNDFEVGSESEERNTEADVYTYPVKLQRGSNRLLLQLGSSEVNTNNFMVRLTSVLML